MNALPIALLAPPARKIDHVGDIEGALAGCYDELNHLLDILPSVPPWDAHNVRNRIALQELRLWRLLGLKYPELARTRS